MSKTDKSLVLDSLPWIIPGKKQSTGKENVRSYLWICRKNERMISKIRRGVFTFKMKCYELSGARGAVLHCSQLLQF